MKQAVFYSKRQLQYFQIQLLILSMPQNLDYYQKYRQGFYTLFVLLLIQIQTVIIQQNNYIIKMSQEQLFMNALLDFSNLPSRRTSSFSSQKGKPQIRNLNTQRFDVQIQSQANQKLMQTFNQIRNKLKQSNRQLVISKQKQLNLQKQFKNQREKASKYIIQCQQHKLSNTHFKQQNAQLKRRLLGLKQHAQFYSDQSQQMSFLKTKIVQAHQMINNLKLQNERSMQISIKQKISLQEQVKKAKTMKLCDQQYMKQMQACVSKTKKEHMQLQTQFKKLKISYDEQIYNQKWDNNNFHKQDIQNQLQNTKLLYDQLKIKYTKQKNKKSQLQAKLLQLQEKIGLWGVKADVYQGEVQLMHKKIKKIQKQKSIAKLIADNALTQKLTWQQKFHGCSELLQQLITRVKRQLLGDAVQLAKTCQFRMNKLKQGQRQYLSRTMKQSSKNSAFSNKSRHNHNSKSRVKSVNKQKTILGMVMPQSQNTIFSNSMSNLESQNKKKGCQQNDCINFTRTVLKQSNLGSVCKQLFPLTQLKQRQPLTATTINTPSLHQRQKNEINIQAKIRKQRELMQRKIREKIMYNKIQDYPVQQKSSLRQQYLNFLHK